MADEHGSEMPRRRGRGEMPPRRPAIVAGTRSRGAAKKATVHTSIELDAELDMKLRVHCALERGTSKSKVVNEALRSYLGKHGRGRKYLDSADELAESIAAEADDLGDVDAA